MSLFDLNRATLIGNCTKDPELKYTPNGTAILKFGLATNRSVKKDDSFENITTFHNIIAWSKLAERIAKTLAKGEKVYIEGRIENRSYEKDGVTRYVSEVVADNIITLKKPNKAVKDEDEYKEHRRQREAEKQQDTAIVDDAGQEDINPDDIPF